MTKHVKVFDFINENNTHELKYTNHLINEEQYKKLNEFLSCHDVFQIEKIGNDILVFYEESE